MKQSDIQDKIEIRWEAPADAHLTPIEKESVAAYEWQVDNSVTRMQRFQPVTAAVFREQADRQARAQLGDLVQNQNPEAIAEMDAVYQQIEKARTNA